MHGHGHGGDDDLPDVHEATDLIGRVGQMVRVVGRYEAFDQGRHRTIGPDGPTAWLCELALADGAWLLLGARPDDERARYLGRDVIAKGRLVRPERGPAHVAQMDPSLTLADATIEPAAPLLQDDHLPPGRSGTRWEEVVTTYLEMDRDRAPELPARDGITVIAATPMTVRFYRYLYDAVGAPWHWYFRKRLDDTELRIVLETPGIELHVAYEHGNPIGYVELDRTAPGACEISYFGLVPEAIGRGLGRWFLAWAVHHAWTDPALRRLWVHTCTLDGPNALSTYQRVGFTPYRHTRHKQLLVDD